jgi:protein kinase/serine/threonine-protein kinase
MSEQPPRKNLLQEIHRRSVWQVVTVYAVGAWFALEVVQGIVDAGNLPDWLPGMALVLLIIGFPMVLATAIVQQGWSGGSEEAGPRQGPTPSAEDGGGTAAGGKPVGAAAESSSLSDSPTPAGPDTTHSAPVNLAAGTGSLDRSPTRPSTAHRLFNWRNAIAGGVLAFALWGVVATALLLSGRAGPRESSSGPSDSGEQLRAIAVLPFDNLSTEEENAYFADGIHEDVLTQLSKLGDLTVISRTSVLPYRSTEQSLGAIASELGVGSILEGSVRRAGDNVRITAQLIDARTDEHLWADNFDRQLTAANIFAIQSEIAQRIAEALAATLSPAEEERITRSPTADLAAYDFYLQARNTYWLYTDRGNDEAIRLFKEALDRDPDYADAWAGLADAYAQRVVRFGYGREWADSAEAVARRALQIDPDLPQGYKALALAYNSRGQLRASLESNLEAVELDPNYSAPLNNIGVDQLLLGRIDEALRYHKRAYRLEPTTGFASSNIAFDYAFLGMPNQAEARALEILRLQPSNESAIAVLRSVDQLRGDYAGALARSRAVVQADPGVSRTWLWVAGDAFLLKDFETALEATEEALRLSPDTEYGQNHYPRVVLGVSLIRTGQEDRGRQVLEAFREDLLRRVEEMPEQNFNQFSLAAIEAARGDAEAALDWMEAAYDQGYRFTIGLDVDPAFDSVRDHPRWQAIVTRMAEDVAVMRANVQREEGESGVP